MTTKCDICGRFISDRDFIEGKTGGNYVPLSEFTKEEITHWHLECETDKSSDHGVGFKFGTVTTVGDELNGTVTKCS